ncbi:MAG: (E)-4-hydroxy-3-methylbut-2-enyl-diphosphate synthase [Chloroflexota bacterium]
MTAHLEPLRLAEDLRYCRDSFAFHRRPTREVMVGTVGVGGANPIRIQSMTTTRTQDVAATVAQARRLANVGCEIVRVTAPTVQDARALKDIRRQLRAAGMTNPLVADIHFSPAAAMEAADHVEKVRINPGNFADSRTFAIREYSDREYEDELERIEARFTPLVLKCKANGIAMRVGTNHGSLSDRIMNRFGDTPLGMVESALEFLRICRTNAYLDVILSMKASNPKVMIQAYRLLVARMDLEGMDFPLHLGVTEAGNDEDGRIKSAVGIGALLDDGLGDTIRVSLTEEPEAEIPVAIRLAAPYQDRADEHLGVSSRPERRDPYSFSRRLTTPCPVGPNAIGGQDTIRVLRAPRTGRWDLATRAAELASGGQPGAPSPDLIEVTVGSSADLETLVAVRQALTDRAPGASLVAAVAEDRSVWEPAAAIADALRWEANGPIVPAGIIATAREHQRGLLLITAASPDGDAAVNRLNTWAIQCTAAGLSRLAFGVRAMDVSTAVRVYRKLAAVLDDVDLPYPLHLIAPAQENPYDRLLRASVCLGSLLCDGIGDSVEIPAPEDAQSVRLAFNVLQAAGARISKTEFVACPSCGRTLFDLQPTTDRIKQRTGHLVGVKIAIMGCIVNGPGEMADADFGYVGGAPGKVNLYVGKECVERNVPQEQADDRLVELIRSHGRWVDPPA